MARWLAVLTFVLTGAASADVPSALARGRGLISSHQCHEAVGVLQQALPEASSFRDWRERAEAMSALHFYTAVAFTDCGLIEKAEEQLVEFFRLRPGPSSIDPSKFSREFTAAFEAARRSLAAIETFDRFYPGYNAYADPIPEKLALALWTTSSAFQILALDEEKTAWGRAQDEAGRSAFIAEFWERRDPDPLTETNELRSEVERRVAFADRAFTAGDYEMKGSMSDRGRVFVLLGPPSRVYRQGLQRFETTFANRRVRTPVTGFLERWIYFREQLPAAIPAQQVEFRFITQDGYGDAVLQSDMLPLKALKDAKRTRGRAE